jgi:hypothetical protein
MGKSKIIREAEEKKQGTMSEYRNRRQRTLQGGEAGISHSQFPMQQNEHAIYSWSYVRCEAGAEIHIQTGRNIYSANAIGRQALDYFKSANLSPEIPTAGVDEAAEEEKGCGVQVKRSSRASGASVL